jgi:hypothetical protein
LLARPDQHRRGDFGVAPPKTGKDPATARRSMYRFLFWLSVVLVIGWSALSAAAVLGVL